MKSSNPVEKLGKCMSIGAVLAVLAALMSVGAAQAIGVGTQAEELARMEKRAREDGRRAAYLFDLDETIVDSTPRRFRSIVDAVEAACAAVPAPSPDCETIAKSGLKLADFYRLRNRYDVGAFLYAEGARDLLFVQRIVDDSFRIYLSGAYIVEEDRLYEGALAFIRKLKKSGAKVFYASARWESSQLRPTVEFLRRRGLIEAGEENMVYLRKDGVDSPTFKHAAAQAVEKRTAPDGGRVVGIFENEPENLSIWAEIFPRATAFFVIGAYMKNGTIPAYTVLLNDFRI